MTTHKDRLKFSVSAVASAGLGAFTVSTAVSGFQTLGSGDDGETFDLFIVEGTAWEVREGCTYTHSGTSLSRGTLRASSTGSAIAFTSAAVVAEGVPAFLVAMVDVAMAAVLPGGRLTLSTGVPVTTSDVTGATSIYYTPYVTNVIPLWDGARWRPVEFSQYTLALGTLTSGHPYDVFAYLSSGALALEVLAWSSSTARATAVTLQDGRYCKSGDKTRLLLGSFLTTSTTTTEDSAAKRFVSNVYNRVQRKLFKSDATSSWTYSGTSKRYANNDSSNKVELFSSLGDAHLDLQMYGMGMSLGADFFSQGIGEDSASTYSSNSLNYQAGGGGTYLIPLASMLKMTPAVGYHYYAWLEATGSAFGANFYSLNSGIRQAGLSGFVMG